MRTTWPLGGVGVSMFENPETIFATQKESQPHATKPRITAARTAAAKGAASAAAKVSAKGSLGGILYIIYYILYIIYYREFTGQDLGFNQGLRVG